jgi:hypothetical protein
MNSTWEGFLPNKAIVMARRRDFAPIAEAEVSSVASCTVCKKYQISAVNQGGAPASRIALIVEGPLSAEAQVILDRIIAALTAAYTTTLKLRPSDFYTLTLLKSLDSGPCVHQILKECAPRIAVLFGEMAALVAKSGMDPSVRLISVSHPQQMISSPELKKPDWVRLQEISKILEGDLN